MNFCFVIGLTASQLAEANKFTFFGPRLEPPHSGLSSCVVVGWRSKWPSTQLLVLFCSNAALLTPAGTWAHGGHGSLPGLATRERADLRTNTPWTGCSIDGFAQCSESKSYTRVLRTFCVQAEVVFTTVPQDDEPYFGDQQAVTVSSRLLSWDLGNLGGTERCWSALFLECEQIWAAWSSFVALFVELDLGFGQIWAV